MPTVQIMRENRETRATAEVRHYTRLIEAGVPVAQLLAAGGTIEFNYPNHVDAEGRLILD